ncbi:MAG: glucose-6-phosphate isomerase [Gammaproteobacteria bacterium]|nr:glucose-6-phosphate isomerase [Gammaproteobacteria bacterium]MCW5582645.1 glucose-6-phosphate isomerase [Gammaproteobacteria bacterium]
MINRIDLKEWQALVNHQHHIANHHMRDWFTEDPERSSRYTLECGEILLDYSRNRITHDTIALLCNLAHAVQLTHQIEALFTGQPVNRTEDRPALHTVLRNQNHTALYVKGENITLQIKKSQEKIGDFVNQVHAHKWTGVTGKPISHIVSIGIGGSHLGPMMCTHALQEYAVTDLNIHYISSVDDTHLNEILQKIDPEATLFIISSKSFLTIETLTNAQTILTWMQSKLGNDALKRHFIAVTAAPEKAIQFGVPEENIFPLWTSIGGRYSIWSAIGLPLVLLIGNKNFSDFLRGAHAMDEHFRQADFAENMPVLLAMLSIWYTNFFDCKAHAIVPYTHRLKYFIPYLQQAEMESNGKSMGLNGHKLNYATSPVIFGGEGCDGQHAYHQLLHQGQHLIPVDFILTGNLSSNHSLHHQHQNILIASCLSQAQALMQGKTYHEAYANLLATPLSPSLCAELAHHQMVPGNKPSNILFLQRISPKNIGALIALYEHKVFVQSVIWNINPFDQWGVELGKQLLPNILQCIQDTGKRENTCSIPVELIHHIKNVKGQA